MKGEEVRVVVFVAALAVLRICVAPCPVAVTSCLFVCVLHCRWVSVCVGVPSSVKLVWPY